MLSWLVFPQKSRLRCAFHFPLRFSSNVFPHPCKTVTEGKIKKKFRPDRFAEDSDDGIDAYMEQKRVALEDRARNNEAVGTEFDQDDNPIVTAGSGLGLDKKKSMSLLPIVDHSKVQYESFRKVFYSPKEEVLSMPLADVVALRVDLAALPCIFF